MELKDVLKKVGPTLAALLGGPFAGMAVEAIGLALNVPEPTLAKVEKALTSGNLNGDQLAAIKLAEQQVAIRLEELGVRREELVIEDRKSARDMQIATRSSVPAVLTYIITLGFFSILGAMFYFPAVKESAPLMIMLGSLGTAWTGACAFWFGTTANSQNKTNLLAQSSPVVR